MKPVAIRPALISLSPSSSVPLFPILSLSIYDLPCATFRVSSAESTLAECFNLFCLLREDGQVKGIEVRLLRQGKNRKENKKKTVKTERSHTKNRLLKTFSVHKPGSFSRTILKSLHPKIVNKSFQTQVNARLLTRVSVKVAQIKQPVYKQKVFWCFP